MQRFFVAFWIAGVITATVVAAPLRVVVSYPWIRSLVEEIADDQVSLYTLAKGSEDPHFVVPKPSHIAKLRKADLLIIQGASLEIGFLPPLVRQANNPVIFPGNRGFLDLSTAVSLIEQPQAVSRAAGDVHPQGHPHYHLDPHNIPVLARTIETKLCDLDPDHCPLYRKRLEDFLRRWQAKLQQWDQQCASLKGAKVVTYHKLYDYFLRRYGMQLVGTLEPLPGISPSAKHLIQLIQQMRAAKVRWILQDVYHEQKTARYVASKTQATVKVLPHDVGALPTIHSIFDLFDYIVKQLTVQP